MISIIIPAYNAENFMEECVESVLSQAFQDYEILLVNDGSTDGTPLLCDSYAKKYDFIHAIHKANGGSASARNEGIRAASGDYVLFIDSDDYIGAGSLEKIMDKLNSSGPDGVDVMFLEMFRVFDGSRTVPLNDGYIEEKIVGKSKAEVMEHLAGLPKYPGSACTKLIRRSLIVENDLFFINKFFAEDTDWTLRLFCAAQTFSYCDVPYYFYRQFKGSKSHRITLNKAECPLQIIDDWASRTMKRPFQKEINAFLAYIYMVTLYDYACLSVADRKYLYLDMKKNVWILSWARCRKARITAVMVKILGIRLTAFLLKKAYEIR